MRQRDETLLVAIVNTRADLQRFRDERWYRVPCETGVTKDRTWPPQWLAAFETVGVAEGTQQVLRYARVLDVEVRSREELFPGVPPGARAGKQYFKLNLGPVEDLPRPLIPVRRRRNPFIKTRLSKLFDAGEFNDIFDDSPYEEDLWRGLKSLALQAERQWGVSTANGNFLLDFAVFCRDRSIDVEVDGRQHHSIEGRSIGDAERDKQLALKGWAVTRFRTAQIARQFS